MIVAVRHRAAVRVVVRVVAVAVVALVAAPHAGALVGAHVAAALRRLRVLGALRLHVAHLVLARDGVRVRVVAREVLLGAAAVHALLHVVRLLLGVRGGVVGHRRPLALLARLLRLVARHLLLLRVLLLLPVLLLQQIHVGGQIVFRTTAHVVRLSSSLARHLAVSSWLFLGVVLIDRKSEVVVVAVQMQSGCYDK